MKIQRHNKEWLNHPMRIHAVDPGGRLHRNGKMRMSKKARLQLRQKAREMVAAKSSDTKMQSVIGEMDYGVAEFPAVMQ